MAARIPLTSSGAAELASRRLADSLGELLARSLPVERRAAASELLVATVVRGLQDNVTVSGRRWDDVPQEEDPRQDMDIGSLDKTRNDHIMTVAGKRRRYPKRIVKHFVRELKAERECLKLYHPYLAERLKKKYNTAEATDGTKQKLSEQVACVSSETAALMKLLPCTLTKVDGLSKAVELTLGLGTGSTNAAVYSPHVEVTPVGEAHGGSQPPVGTPTKAALAERHSVLRPGAQGDERRRVALRRRLAVDMSPE